MKIKISKGCWQIVDFKYEYKDNGVGFDPVNAQKIFNAFERLYSKDEFEGTGLGLALCKKIVERHLGSIEAAGDKNDGAEFMVSLPLVQKKYKSLIILIGFQSNKCWLFLQS